MIALVLALMCCVPMWAGTLTRAMADTSNVGGASVDAGGARDQSFLADSNYSGGATAGNNGQTGNPNSPLTVAHPIPVNDWNSYRYLDNTYTIPALAPGASYQVRLYFLEWYWTKVGKRAFNVSINGTPALTNFDILQASANAGGDGTHQGVEKDFTAVADADGNITIAFSRGTADQALVNAISVVPAS
ncbi:malectin domain-containing carbohydrate-binding protein [Streptomyces sp. NPDC048527]|uniref:malectin domain-containing carbohydrate-binding protein n=1 Tax=Streptomyces sp. NPDC048527 TaxID=3365568 RepID=UPI003714A880